MTSFSSLDQEEEEFGQYLYGIAIPDFWSKNNNPTLGGQNRIKQKLSFATAKVVKIRQGQIAGTKASVMKGLSAFGIPLLRREQFSNQFEQTFHLCCHYGWICSCSNCRCFCSRVGSFAHKKQDSTSSYCNSRMNEL